MTDRAPADAATLTPEQARRLDERCNRFEAAWRAGDPPALEDALAGVPAELVAVALAELVLLDAYYRNRAGVPPAAADYRARFPQLDAGWLAQALTDAGADCRPALPEALRDHPRYRVVALLGRGGMGAVYQAEHRLMQRPVALKVLARALVDRADMVERFVAEVRLAAQLAHPNIVRVFDADAANGTHFFTMELIAGTDLAALVRRGPLPVRAACDYIRQAALGLQHAHEHGMTHRDVKPHNLMLAADGTVKVLDFGVARLAETAPETTAAALTVTHADAASRTPVLLGSVDYMAPEQARDPQAADIRSDIYALGCTLYHLLAGRVPFPVTTPARKLHAHCAMTATPLNVVRPAVPAALAAVVARMMAKDPAQRYATPAKVAASLLPFAEGLTVLPRRRLAPRVAGLLLTLAASAALVGWALDFLQLGRVHVDRSRQAVAAVERVAWPAEPVFDPPPGLVWFANNLPGAIQRPALTADGRLLAVAAQRAGKGTGLLYEVRTRETLRSFPSCGLAVFTPDGQALISNVEPDRLARVDVASGQVGPMFAGAQEGLLDVELAPDGRAVLGISPTGSTLWDLATGAVRRRLPGRACFSDDGRQIVTVDDTSDQVTILPYEGDEPLPSLDLRSRQGGQPLRLLPGGCILVRCNGKLGQVEQWDVATRTRTRTLELGLTWLTADIRPAAVSPDGKHLLTCHTDAVVRLWDLETGRQLWQLPVDMAVRGLSFSQDGRFAVAGTRYGMVYVWRLPIGLAVPPPPSVDRHLPDGTREHVWNTFVSHTAYAPDGKHYLATGAWSEQVRVWDDANGRLVRVLPGIQWADFHPDGKHVLAFQPDQSLVLWELATGRAVRRLQGHGDYAGAFDISTDGRRVLSYATDGTMRLWDLETGKELDQTAAPRGKASWRVVFAPDGNHAATHVDGNVISLWDVSADRFDLVRRWDVPDDERGGPLRFTADGSEIVVATNRTVRWYRPGMDRPVRTLPLTGHADAWTHWWSLSRDGRRLAMTPRHGGELRVLELPSGRELARYTAPPELIPAFGSPFGIPDFAPDARQIVAPARYANRDLARVYRYELKAK